MHRVADDVAGCVRFAEPELAEWLRIGNQIDAAFIFARADSASAYLGQFCEREAGLPAVTAWRRVVGLREASLGKKHAFSYGFRARGRCVGKSPGVSPRQAVPNA